MKIKFLFLLLIFPGILFSQLINESFESGILPSNWSTADVTGVNGDWTFLATGSSPTCAPFDGNYMAKFNSFSVSSGFQTRLSSPQINFDALSYQLSFYMFHDTSWLSSNDNIQVQVSTNGIDWVTIATFNRPSATQSWMQHTVDLSAYSNMSGVQIGFLATSAYGNNMYIDMVQVCSDCSTTDIDNSQSNNSLSIYPNPTSDFVKLDLPEFESEFITLSIVDMHGTKVYESTNMQNSSSLVISVKNLPTGNYLLLLKSEGITYSSSIIKQ